MDISEHFAGRSDILNHDWLRRNGQISFCGQFENFSDFERKLLHILDVLVVLWLHQLLQELVCHWVVRVLQSVSILPDESWFQFSSFIMEFLDGNLPYEHGKVTNILFSLSSLVTYSNVHLINKMEFLLDVH